MVRLAGGRRWQLVQGELLSLVRVAIHHLVLGAEGRGLSASHQPCSHQHIQVVRVVVAWAGEEVVAGGGVYDITFRTVPSTQELAWHFGAIAVEKC